jgi:uncharacterized YccA/Bax inhibitor family protein
MATKSILTLGGDGTAVPALNVGETKQSTSVRSFSNNGAASTGWAIDSGLVGDRTLTPGKWLVNFAVAIGTTSGSSTGFRTAVLTTDSSDGWAPASNLSAQGLGNLNVNAGDLTACSFAVVTVNSGGIVGGTGFQLFVKFFVTTHSSFTGSYGSSIIATRIA